jgi:hypothetical protein
MTGSWSEASLGPSRYQVPSKLFYQIMYSMQIAAFAKDAMHPIYTSIGIHENANY